MSKIHQEERFEAHIVDELCERGWREGESSDYDRSRALLPEEIVKFVRQTQPTKWDYWKEMYGDKLGRRIVRQVAKKCSQKGSLEVLRHGFRLSGRKLRLAFFEPAHGLNPSLREKYEQNRLTVIRQLPYNPSSTETLDLGLFLNGIPVMTAELKTSTTNQTWVDAKQQYKERNPKAPLFRFKERALVHFAVDPDQVHMTTEVAGDSTFFLPFNKGKPGGHAGNPRVEDKHRTHYLWEEFWERKTFLELVGRYIHVQIEEERDAKGRRVEDETLIFPRYHQYECVEKLIDATVENGPGENYLVQHSTGSGKSISIAWLAHRLQSLHGADDEKVFDSVVVVTDRRVLDAQISTTIYQIDHQEGVVHPTDHSGELAERLEEGAPIVISTLQTFPFVSEKIAELPERNYAVIVDEGHRSQSGSMAAKLKEILSNESDFAEELDTVREFEELSDEGAHTTKSGELYKAAYRAAMARGPRPNLSFYAFTGTPKYKTLEIFGDTDEHGRPAPFHNYSMQQAIEEEFILDVLQNYVTYETYYQLVKKSDEKMEVDKSKASERIKKFIRQHPHNVEEKSRIMVEHFQQHTRAKIGGRAKAMVVTSSRAQAVQFKQAIDEHIEERGWDIGTLVAFSGEVEHPHTGIGYTEQQMNGGIKQSELPEKFHTDDYRILVVANKYQTGFDEPLLHTMYVDRRIGNVQAVQTLSRLNRRHSDKEDTLVLDFANRREDILASFERFYTTTTADEEVDHQKLYDVKDRLDEFRIIWQEDVDAVAEIVFGVAPEAANSGRLNDRLDAAVDRYREKSEEEQEDFRSLLSTFVRLYKFMAQVIPYTDAELEKFFVYARMLDTEKLTETEEQQTQLDIEDVAGLEYYTNRKAGEGSLSPGGGEPVKGPTDVGTGGPTQEELIELSQIIEAINDRFGTDFDEEDEYLFDQVKEAMTSSQEVEQRAQVNDREHFLEATRDELRNKIFARHGENGDIVRRVAEDSEFGEMVVELLASQIYNELNGTADPAGA